MATWDFKGLDLYVAQLQKLGENTDSMISSAVYVGAGYVADRVKEALDDIPIDNRRYVNDMRTGITDEQKQGLLDGFGISAMQNKNGYVNVKLGFDGYNSVVTKTFPKGQPNVLIARATESGSSFLPKFGTISKAVNASKAQAEEIMKKELDNQMRKGE